MPSRSRHKPESSRPAPTAPTQDAIENAITTYCLIAAPKLIATPKEYGLSFQAEVKEGDVNTTEGEVNAIYGTLKLDEVIQLPHSIFLKCPQDGTSSPTSDEFLAEYENRAQISYAAERLVEYGRLESRHLKVNITKMLGKGSLEINGQQARPCLIYEFIRGQDLEKQPLPLPEKIKTSAQFLDFALDLATAVQKLHNQGVVHSFIVPRNLVRTNLDEGEIPEVSLVGFGYTRLCDTRGKAGSPLTVLESDKLFRAPECRAESPHSAFWFPADIYSIGAILYHWLAREPTESGSSNDELNVLRHLSPDVRLLKKTIADTLRKTASHIIEGNENILKILDSCLRYRAEDRFSCVEELIESIKLAITAGRKGKESERQTKSPAATSSRGNEATTIDVTTIEQWEPSATKSKRDPLPSYFYDLKHTLAESLKADFTAIASGHYEVYGHRDKIVTSLCHLLASAEPGDTYCTMTLPDYWADDNLGSNGRFLVMNKHMVRQGVNITRLYLVSREFHELSEGEQYILDQQLEAQEDLADYAKRRRGSKSKPGKMEIYVLKVDEHIIGDFEKDGSMVGFLQKKSTASQDRETEHDANQSNNQDFVCLNFFSTANVSWINGKEIVKRRIHKVRYWRLNDQRRTRFDTHKARFDEYVENAMTLSRYIRQEEPDIKNFGMNELKKLIKGSPKELGA